MSVLNTIFCTEFEKNVGRWQSKEDKPKVMEISFCITNNWNIEEGYRNLDIRIYAPANYVAVLVRERWNVIPLKDLGYDKKAEESFIKKGRDYRDGSTNWMLAGYHDSCWRDTLDRVVKEMDNEILVLNTNLRDWYQIVELDEQELEAIDYIVRHWEENRYIKHNGVLRFNEKGKEYYEQA